MKIKITSDSTCDLTQELLDRFHIATVPLYVIMDGVSYKDSVDITTCPVSYTHLDVYKRQSLC